MLTAEQLKLRAGLVTASFLPILMQGDKAKILNRWQEIIGDPDYVAEDLSGVWPVQFGSYIEPFALDWHQKKTGQPLTRRGEVIKHPYRPYFCCTLDAWRESDSTVIDCKAPGAYRKLDDVVSYYVPQMIGQVACVGANRAALLIVHGGAEPVEYPVDWTPEYEAQVWERVEQFQRCCETLTPPVTMDPIAPPFIPVKEYNFSTSNTWVSAAATWLQNREASKTFDAAAKEIKAAVPADGMRAFGGGIMVSRNKAGSLSIKKG